MDQRIGHLTWEVEQGGRRVADVAGAAATRAPSSVQARVDQASDHAQDLALDVRDHVARLTDTWAADARRYVRTHPLQSIALTLGLGFVLGKLLRRS